MKHQYRLKKGARSHKGQDKWINCTTQQKERIEKMSPNRFEFRDSIKAEVPEIAVIKPKIEVVKPKPKKKAEDK